jgi:tRNA(Ile)-lysidine synthase TilS/MesJ
MEKKHHITYDSTKENAFTVHLQNKTVKFIKSSNGLYYHKPKYNTNINKDRTPVNHTINPITASVKSFSHVMIAGVDDNFAEVARNTTKNNDINTSKLVEILEDKPSKTLVEFVDNTIQVKKPKENVNNNIRNDLQLCFNMAENTKNNKIKKNKKKTKKTKKTKQRK